MRDRRRIGQEIAAADHAGGKRAFPALLVEVARRLERSLGKRRKLRRELRALEVEIKIHRRELKAMAGVEERDDLG